ncbi:MAG TPA: hypothetical protein DDX71_02805 [Ruminococcus sp.]|nr:hypothetical protein [Ruminococcus sp.]
MTDTLLEQLESLIGSDDFEYESAAIIGKLKEEGAGLETVGKLFGIIERHPLDDFGNPGEIAYFIEDFYPDYLPALIDSVNRTPALHTLWMLNRCVNAAEHKEELLSILKKTADDAALEREIRDSAASFYDYQTGKRGVF